MSDRIGDWMQTYRGGQFWPLDPRADEVFIEDIAHALAHQCRFAGHCDEFYSVAEHSVRASQIVPGDDALWALLHDASEAYLVDLPRPVKRHSEIGKHYMAAEWKVMNSICERFGLPVDEPASVMGADNVMLMTEARDLMKKPPVAWRESAHKPLDEKIVPWTPRMAEENFLGVFTFLSHRLTDAEREEHARLEKDMHDHSLGDRPSSPSAANLKRLMELDSKRGF